MTEKYKSSDQPTPSPENLSDKGLDASVLFMMNFETTILRYQPPETETGYNTDTSIAFGQKLLDWRPTFDGIFEDARAIAADSDEYFIKLFGKDWVRSTAWNQDDARTAEVIMGAGPIAEMRHRANRPGSPDFRPTFSKYNSVIRDVIRANPSMSEVELTGLLEKGLDWAHVPQRYRAWARDDLKKIIHGASSEVVAKQLLDSEAVQEAGIIYKSSSIEDDLIGIDFIVVLANGKKLLLDIKRNDEQVQREGLADFTTPSYNILNSSDPDDVRVELYLGANDALEKRKGRLLLQLEKEDVERKGAALAETLQEIAEEAEGREQQRLLGKLARKYKKP